jgi:transcriptional regulator with XRE-family HTH domain
MPAPLSRDAMAHVRAWRLSKLWTQQKLAAESGVSVPTIIRAEQGAKVGALTATKLARALGVSVNQLRNEEPQV